MSTFNPFICPLLTDFYQISMLFAYWNSGRHSDIATFDCFFRKPPFKGEIAVFAGISEFLEFLERGITFTEDDLEFLRVGTPLAGVPEQTLNDFFSYLRTISASQLRVWAIPEGTVVFPRVPLVRVEGPLPIAQLVETTLLNCINFPTLIATKAAHLRLTAGPNVSLLEFGLRRAQGPDGAVTASRYSYLGGFDGTSNVLAGKLYKIPVSGTVAHAYIMSYPATPGCITPSDAASGASGRSPSSASPLAPVGTPLCPPHSAASVASKHRPPPVLRPPPPPGSVEADVYAAASAVCDALVKSHALAAAPNKGELRAFCAYAAAFPRGCLVLVDTYDTLVSGVPNFICVAVGLAVATGCAAKGVRLDSGDLAYLSVESKRLFKFVAHAIDPTAVPAESFSEISADPLVVGAAVRDAIAKHIAPSNTARVPGSTPPTTADAAAALSVKTLLAAIVVASNDLDVDVIEALNAQGHAIDAYGVGTQLVTCARQPALGAVYKLSAVNGQARMKFSEEKVKQSIPCPKAVYRLYGKDGAALLDYMDVDPEASHAPTDVVGEVLLTSMPPVPLTRILCHHTFDDTKRCYVTPSTVERLDKLVWDCGRRVPVEEGGALPALPIGPHRDRVAKQLRELRSDHKRSLNPTPYKVSLSSTLWGTMQKYWAAECPVKEIA